jgi:hypothetical protein
MATIIEQYSYHSEEIEKNLKLLQKKLKKHKSGFKENPKNWGYVGDLTYIKEKLVEINAFLRD